METIFIKAPKVGECTGCVFLSSTGKCADRKNLPCEGGIYIPSQDVELAVVSALDISLVDGLLLETIQICEESESRIKPFKGESIRDFIKRLIYNQAE
jgi:hypothetical protein